MFTFDLKFFFVKKNAIDNNSFIENKRFFLVQIDQKFQDLFIACSPQKKTLIKTISPVRFWQLVFLLLLILPNS